VQAQTLTTLRTARELGLVIIPAISKIDSPLASTDLVREQVAKLLNIDESEILLLCSGRTGEGVEDLLKAVILRVPAPKKSLSYKEVFAEGLIFDFQYSDHQGVIVFLRMFDGSIKKGSELEFAQTGRTFTALEVGTFSPKPKATDRSAKVRSVTW
jgi:GTP-binding protein LepA